MPHWLIKEEPTHYSFDDLVRDRCTQWSGVHNALALRHLRAMRPGDEAFYYHTGKIRALVGIVQITGQPHPDLDDPRPSYSVEVRPVRSLRRPIALSELKADPRLAGFDLIRISRLTVLPVPETMWRRVLTYEGKKAPRSK